MLAAIEGTLEGRGPDFAIVKVAGFSLKVHAPSSTLASLEPQGHEVRLHTHLYVKDDAMALYGFASTEELEVFELLIGVSGVGPRAALALLSALRPEQLAAAIASGNSGLLTQVPGVGQRLAGRLVLELKGKVGRLGLAAALPQSDAEVVAALTSLGYTLAEATAAAASLPPSPDLPLEERLRLALQSLGRS